MKKIIFIVVFGLSVGGNLYLAGSSYLKNTHTPTKEDLEILGEMTKMVLETDQYEDIASKEQVFSIEPGVSRFNVANPSSIFHYEVYVKTNEQTHIFYCDDETCANVSNGGSTYSRYSEEEPILPLKKIPN